MNRAAAGSRRNSIDSSGVSPWICGERLSRIVTSSPRSASLIARALPIKPAPPVMSIFTCRSPRRWPGDQRGQVGAIVALAQDARVLGEPRVVDPAVAPGDFLGAARLQPLAQRQRADEVAGV